MTKYNQVWTGVLNYYSFAYNRCQLNLIQYILQHSLACTVMNKLKLGSRRQVFLKYGATIKVPLEITNREDGNKEKKAKTVEFKLQPSLKRICKYSTSPADPFQLFYYNLRSRSRIDDNC